MNIVFSLIQLHRHRFSLLCFAHLLAVFSLSLSLSPFLHHFISLPFSAKGQSFPFYYILLLFPFFHLVFVCVRCCKLTALLNVNTFSWMLILGILCEVFSIFLHAPFVLFHCKHFIRKYLKVNFHVRENLRLFICMCTSIPYAHL